MPFTELDRPACFTNQLEKLIKKYKKSETALIKEVNSILKKPLELGNRIPKFGSDHIRKLRIPLKEYNIGKSGGIRIIYLVDIDTEKVLMVAMYIKSDYKTETSTQSMIRKNLKSIDSAL
ncbi:MAG: hypothetical protein ACUZ8N_11530 [Candidatus Scalindua sp.]